MIDVNPSAETNSHVIGGLARGHTLLQYPNWSGQFADDQPRPRQDGTEQPHLTFVGEYGRDDQFDVGDSRDIVGPQGAEVLPREGSARIRMDQAQLVQVDDAPRDVRLRECQSQCGRAPAGFSRWRR